jgi:hypothetical protein
MGNQDIKTWVMDLVEVSHVIDRLDTLMNKIKTKE